MRCRHCNRLMPLVAEDDGGCAWACHEGCYWVWLARSHAEARMADGVADPLTRDEQLAIDRITIRLLDEAAANGWREY